MPTFWDGASSTLILDSIRRRIEDDDLTYQQELERYANYRDGRPSCVKDYFKKRNRESDERFRDRPKLSIPLCRTIVDVHAEALTKGVEIKIDDDSTQEIWDEIAEHTDFESYLNLIATTLGTYGHTVVRPILYDDGTREKALEFDSFTPIEARVIYESGNAGRSNPHIHGVVLYSLYHLENAANIPPGAASELKEKDVVKDRIEFISKKRQLVWLDNQITGESPFGEMWMWDEEGTNPYPFIPVSMVNGMRTEESVLGISDIHTAIYDVQDVNEIWSDYVYTHRMYVPQQIIKADTKATLEKFNAGIGVAWEVKPHEDVTFANPDVNFDNALLPLKVAIELALANAKTPATSVGMGGVTLAGQSAAAVSGVSKAYEWKPTVRHAEMKQPHFARGVRDLVKRTLDIAAISPPFGQGKKGIKPDARVSVSFSGDIVPTTAMETLELQARAVVTGMKSTYQAMIDAHGWTPERAQLEMDMIAAETRRRLADDLGFKHIVDIVMDKQAATLSSQEMKDAAAVLFGADRVMGADVRGASDSDGAEQDGRDGRETSGQPQGRRE